LFPWGNNALRSGVKKDQYQSDAGGAIMQRKFRKPIIFFFVTVFLFAGVTIAGLAAMLHRGIHIEHFSLKSIQLENCYIVWDSKIRVSIKTINILSEDIENSSLPGVTDMRGYMLVTKYAGYFISEVSVENLKYKNFSGAFKYTGWSDGTPGAIQVSSPAITGDVTIQYDGNDFVLEIKKLSSNAYRSDITGSARITDEDLVTGKLLADIAGILPLSLTFAADNKGLSFATDKPVTVSSITPVVDLFQLNPKISPWISEYLKGSSYQLTHLEGTLLWDDPASFLESVQAKVRVQDCEYTFAQELEPIKSEYTNVVFDKSVLSIHPHNARFYGQDSEKSWVKIDFTEPTKVLLTAYIDTHAVINDDIINLLGHYRIALPVKQTKGTTATDLVLEINLSAFDLDATATFKVDQGVFMYEGMVLDVSDCIVLLKDTNITIQRMQLAYPEAFTVKVSGDIALSEKYGDISIIVVDSKFKAGDSEIILHNGSETLSYLYHIRPDGNSVESSASTWQFKSNLFHLAPYKAPFNLSSQILSVPPTSIKTTKSQSEAKISGEINIKSRVVDLLLDFNSYRRGNIELAQPHWKLGVHIGNGLKIDHWETSKWLINNIATTLSANEIHYENDELTIKDGHLTYGDFFEGSVDGSFNFKTTKGTFFISKLDLKNDTVGTLLSDYDGFEVIASGDEKSTEFYIPVLDVIIESAEDGGWQVTFRDLDKLGSRFPFLKRYHLTDGTISFGSKNGKKPYHFQGTITYPYSLFIVGDSIVDHYDFSGTIAEAKISAQVIEKLSITIDKKITITSDNVEYNIVELVKLLKNLSKVDGASSKKDHSRKMELTARNSSLYFRPESRVLADKLLLRIEDGTTALWLEHESGNAAFVAEDGAFTLDGVDLDDTFMEALLPGSKFSGGSLSFAGRGRLENFDARFRVQNTILENYVVMNNVLSFVNTIPALITFSVPDYAKDGLVVESALLDMSYSDKLYTVNSFDVIASQLNMRGVGQASLLEDNIDLKLNLITQGRKDLSKIPLVGYVLVGDEKVPSIKLEVTGKLSDPDIQNSAFEEVVTLPFDIGLRVLSLPFKWVDDLFSDETPGTDNNNSRQ
jgi:hypothetical protein